MRVALLTPEGEGQLGVSVAGALSREGHDAHVVGAPALTAGNRELILTRRLRLDRALSAALRRPIGRSLAEQASEVTSDRDVEALRRACGDLVANSSPTAPSTPSSTRGL